MRRIREAYENGVDTLDEYKVNKEKCQRRIDNLKKQLASMPKAKNVDKKSFAKKRLRDMEKILSPDIPAKEKNRILRSFIEKIVYDK